MAPWTDKTGLAKATAILATIALVSIGLCGANILATVFVPLSGGDGSSAWITEIWMFAGFAEIAGICTGIAGLLIVGVFALIGLVVRSRSGPEQISPDDNESKERGK